MGIIVTFLVKFFFTPFAYIRNHSVKFIYWSTFKPSVFSHRTNELPIEVLANLLPDDVVCNQAIAGLQEWKKCFVFVEFEEFKELVEDVGITQEVCAVVGTVE